MRFFAALLWVMLLPAAINAQENSSANAGAESPSKFALVIGNGDYDGLSRLVNPANDANDMNAVLSHIGFTVDTVINGNLQQMEAAVERLKNRLSVSKESYGFFFYAGHGVQSGGENYLIPVDANIPNENYLRNRALSVQTMLDDLNDAGNSLNVVVLDACRDNPFGWSRAGGRGLAMVSRQPADSIIVYATSAGQRASDGEGRNGLFTSQLLKNLMEPGIEVKELFNRTGADVSEVSSRQQIPAIYNQFFGIAYLGTKPDEAERITMSRPGLQPLPAYPGRGGEGSARDGKAARLWTIGAAAGTSFAEPWFIGTIKGTIAPLKYSFLEAGCDLGLLSGDSEVGYYSLYPYALYAVFMPFPRKGGWYAGAGGGCMIAEYDFPEGTVSKKGFGLSAAAGINLFDMLDISYTLRTNFKSANHKVSIGYMYRFK